MGLISRMLGHNGHTQEKQVDQERKRSAAEKAALERRLRLLQAEVNVLIREDHRAT